MLLINVKILFFLLFSLIGFFNLFWFFILGCLENKGRGKIIKQLFLLFLLFFWDLYLNIFIVLIELFLYILAKVIMVIIDLYFRLNQFSCLFYMMFLFQFFFYSFSLFFVYFLLFLNFLCIFTFFYFWFIYIFSRLYT
jgi:hypothetical protein